MGTLVFTERITEVSPRLRATADAALATAARLWFAVAVSGQLMMVAYVTWFYGSTAVRGRLDAWSRVVTHGYVRGDAAGNTALIVHLLAAVILIGGGAAQFSVRLRERAPRFHRWTGRVYVVTAVVTSIAGLYLTWIRGTVGDVTQHLGGSLNALLIIGCAAFALRTALARRFADHRRWVLRLFLAVSGSWFFRVGLFLWLIVNQGLAGFDPKTFRGPALTVLAFANSLVPLAVLELHLRAQRLGSTTHRFAMAAALFALTVVMGIGILGATLGMWLPIIRTGRY